MKINEFWESYKNKSEVEKNAISSIYKALDFLFDVLPREKIISVYIKGTFVTRNMNRKSDVDIVPILKDNFALRKLQKARDKSKDLFKPSELLPISLTELRKNKNSKYHSHMKGRPDTFLIDLEHHKLIYGKSLKNADFPMRAFEKIFLGHLKFVKNECIPMHRTGKFGFQQIIKQVFWVCYNEQRILGRNPPRTWNGLNNFVKDKTNIIHKAYYFRMHPTKDKKKRKVFVNYLEKYLENLLTMVDIKKDKDKHF